MLAVIGKAIAFGLLGVVVTPIMVTIAVLTLAYTFDPRCGKPGDSGGCEMGAASMGFVSTVPGFLIGAGFSLFRSYRKRA